MVQKQPLPYKGVKREMWVFRLYAVRVYHSSGYYPSSRPLFKQNFLGDCIPSPSSDGAY
jgi:hypothetical protein